MTQTDIPVSFLHALLGFERASALLAAAGLDQSPAGFVDHLSFWRLLRDNIALTGDENHQIGPTPVPDGSFGLLLAAMRLGSDLGDGLRRLGDAARIVEPDLGVEVSRCRDLSLRFRGRASRDLKSTLGLELMVMVVHAASCWMTGHVIRPLRIIAAPSPCDASGSIYRLIGCPLIRMGTDVSIHYGRADASRPLAAERFDLWPTLIFESYRTLSSVGLEDSRVDVTAAVRARLHVGSATQSAVAAELGRSSASLRRQLSREGSSFRSLQAEIRRQIAVEAIGAGEPLEQVAERVGYSEARSLRRASQRWFGGSPSILRRRPSCRTES